MRTIDRYLQRWRWSVARPWILQGSHLLDIGCHQGGFLDYLGDRISSAVGIDPLAPNRQTPRYQLLSERFTESLNFPDGAFDVITLLATLEHIQDKRKLPLECHRLLRAEGRVILTVPSPMVDGIVGCLRFLRLADGMSMDQHHDYPPAKTSPLFLQHQFAIEHHRRFQLGLNHLFVFRKTQNQQKAQAGL